MTLGSDASRHPHPSGSVIERTLLSASLDTGAIYSAPSMGRARASTRAQTLRKTRAQHYVMLRSTRSPRLLTRPPSPNSCIQGGPSVPSTSIFLINKLFYLLQ